MFAQALHDSQIGYLRNCDSEKKEFKKEYESFLKGLELKGKLAAGEIYNKLTDFLKNLTGPKET